MMRGVLAIDQSTQGTKAAVLDGTGAVIARAYRTHRQIVSAEGYISHDLGEIWDKLREVCAEVMHKADVEIACIALTNQRETSCLWNEEGPLCHAVVWQCARAKDIAESLSGAASSIRGKTGLPLSPYFPAAKYAWLLRHNDVHDGAMLGTVDTYLLWKMTGEFCTDTSNASRTQLYNLQTGEWDRELCELFEIPMRALPTVLDSNAEFGYTDLDGLLARKVPVRGVMGDSHAALYAHGGTYAIGPKVTYGTGSSVMLQTGEKPVMSRYGLSSSAAWSQDGKRLFALEGNINYSCSVITWLCTIGILTDAAEAGQLAAEADPDDQSMLIPAFSGLSAPYWATDARARLIGMSRTTGRNEIVRAAETGIAHQIADVIECLRADTGLPLNTIYADGGATRDRFLMQRQADLAGLTVCIPDTAELSLLGVGRMAGLAAGIMQEETLQPVRYHVIHPQMEEKQAEELRRQWRSAVQECIQNGGGN